MDLFTEEKLKGKGNNIAISSVCNCKCLFCSNEQNPFETKRPGFISRENFIKQLYYLSQKDVRNISLSDVLPGTISEGEAFFHPLFKEFVIMIRETLPAGTIINITTNGGMLTDELIDFLRKHNPVRVSISIPSFNKEYWFKMFGVSNEIYYNNAVGAFRKMGCNASIVALPALTGWDDLENTIATLDSYHVGEVKILHPGYTRYTPNNDFLKYATATSTEELHEFTLRMKEKYSISIMEFSSSEANCNNVAVNYDARISEIFNQVRGKTVLWCTSKAAHSFIKNKITSIAADYRFNNIITTVENKAYGGNIRCAGLLTIDDILEETSKYEFDVAVLPPPYYLNKLGEDLLGKSVADIPFNYIIA